MTASAESSVRHELARYRFVIELDEHEAVLDYRFTGDTMVILHTRVPAAIEGRGVAARLTASALAWARANGRKVSPECSYAQAYFTRHPRDQDLLP